MNTVQEIKAAIDTLSPAERAELETEMLKAAKGPFTPFSIEDLREACEEVARTKR